MYSCDECPLEVNMREGTNIENSLIIYTKLYSLIDTHRNNIA